MKSKIMPSLVLGSICLVAALLLSVVNMFTAPLIEANQAAAASGAFAEVLPGATGQQDLTIDDSYPAVVKAGYKFDNGYVFQMEVSGWSSGLVIMCGIGNDGKVTGMKHIKTSDTYGLEPELNNAYIGKDADTAELIIATGATPKSLTSKGYFEAVTAALQAYTVASGGSVDLRSPLDIKCNDALGTETLTFVKWFAVEVLDGVSAVYVDADASARVYVVGETYIGIFADGTIATTNVSAEDQAKALEADAIVKASNSTDITSELGGAVANVTKVEKTDSGNYIINVLGEGYKYESNFQFVGIKEGQIEIKVAISADGKIIDVNTMKHQETNGYGSACDSEEYYEQFRGANDSDIVVTVPFPDFHDDQIPAEGCTDIGAIANSTFTSTGYQAAIKDAFAAFNLLNTTEGGNQ